MMTQRLKQSLKHSMLLRYWSIGGVATGIHYLVFLLLLGVFNPVTATLIGGLMGAIFSYWANKRITFMSNGSKELGSLRFYAVTLLFNLANAGCMWWVSHNWPQGHVVVWLLVQVVITLVLSVISFFIHKYWSYHYA